MKFRWDKKYLYWGITAFLTLTACMVFFDFLFIGNSIMAFLSKSVVIAMPIIYGLVIAYLLTPVVNWLEMRFLFPAHKKLGLKEKKVTAKRIRMISIIITMVIALGTIYGLFAMVIPQVLNSIMNIVEQLPVYEKNMEAFITRILAANPQLEVTIDDMLYEYSGELNNWLNTKVIPQLNVVLKEVSVSVIGLLKALWNLILGLIISIYVLSSKELFAAQGKKIIYALFEEKTGNQLIRDLRSVNATFGGFISGKILDSLIIGILCFIGITILDMPYPLLISVIIGVTNVIPFFGPYIGAIPCIILILMVNPLQALYFSFFILLLQQFDGNFLGPKILGDSTGLSSFWVIFSITVFGGYFGILGMAVGVPTFAVIYAAFKRYVNRSLKKKGLSTDTNEYLYLSDITNNKYNENFPPKNRKLEKQENTKDKSNLDKKDK